MFADALHFLPGAFGEVRLQHGPPTVVELGLFLPAEQRTLLRDVTVSDEEVLQAVRVAPDDTAEKVVHPLEDNGMVAREILKS